MGSGGEYAEVSLGSPTTSPSNLSDARAALVPARPADLRQSGTGRRRAGCGGVFIRDPRLRGVGAARTEYLDEALRELASSDRWWCVPAIQPVRCWTSPPSTGHGRTAPATPRRSPVGGTVRSPIHSPRPESPNTVDTPYAIPPGRCSTAGSAYRVFTPFYKAWLARGWPAPADPVVETPAVACWRRFRDEALGAYKRDRDFPALAATSRLSAALHFGQIHPRTILARIPTRGHRPVRANSRGGSSAPTCFWHQPQAVWSSLDPASTPTCATTMTTRCSRRGGRAHRLPFVDAGMRQPRRRGLDAQPPADGDRQFLDQGPAPAPGNAARRGSCSTWSTPTWRTTNWAGSGWPGWDRRGAPLPDLQPRHPRPAGSTRRGPHPSLRPRTRRRPDPTNLGCSPPTTRRPWWTMPANATRPSPASRRCPHADPAHIRWAGITGDGPISGRMSNGCPVVAVLSLKGGVGKTTVTLRARECGHARGQAGTRRRPPIRKPTRQRDSTSPSRRPTPPPTLYDGREGGAGRHQRLRMGT